LAVFQSVSDDVRTISNIQVLAPGSYAISDCRNGNVTLVNESRLPDLGTFGNGSKSASELDQVLRSQLVLPEGILTTTTPARSDAEKPWDFGDTGPHDASLTDRCRFTCSTTASERLTIASDSHSIEATPLNGIFRIVVLSIDRTLGARRNPFRKGIQLTEFDLLYDCTKTHGPLPTFADPNRSNPSESLCPSGRVRVGN
jgi:hypothetical protein